MAATAWSIYNRAKFAIGNGTIVLGTTALKLKLYTSASNASTFTLSTLASVSNQAAGGGYSNGKALASMVWTVGASAKQYKFSSANVIFTANGSSLVNAKFAVIGVSGGKALCWSKLSTAAFTVTSPNTLTVQMNASGIFVMV